MKNMKPNDEIDLSIYAPVLTKDCQGRCDRKVVLTKEGPLIVCNGCSRIVMDNRK
jgi:hypothetical protein